MSFLFGTEDRNRANVFKLQITGDPTQNVSAGIGKRFLRSDK